MSTTSEDTKRLRNHAIRRLGAKRKDNRAHLYDLPDNTTAMIQTSNLRQLMGRSTLFVHNTNFIVIVMPKEANRIDSGVELYVVPTDEVRQALATVQAEWRANPATVSNTDDDIEVLLFDSVAPGRADSFENKHSYAERWKKYLLPNGRLVECPGFRLVSQQVLMTSTTREGLVELLRQQAATFSPSNSIEEYMAQVSARVASVEPWDQVRCDSVEHFIDDMITTGTVSEYIKREYEWIAL